MLVTQDKIEDKMHFWNEKEIIKENGVESDMA